MRKLSKVDRECVLSQLVMQCLWWLPRTGSTPRNKRTQPQRLYILIHPAGPEKSGGGSTAAPRMSAHSLSVGIMLFTYMCLTVDAHRSQMDSYIPSIILMENKANRTSWYLIDCAIECHDHTSVACAAKKLTARLSRKRKKLYDSK